MAVDGSRKAIIAAFFANLGIAIRCDQFHRSKLVPIARVIYIEPDVDRSGLTQEAAVPVE